MNIKTFKGDFLELGRQQGKIYKQNGMDLSEIKIDSELFEKQLAVYTEHYPELLEEFRGMAEAGSFDADKLTYFFITGQITSHINRFNLQKSCTIFGVKNKSGVYVGRNYDWHPVTGQVFQVYKVANPTRNSFIAFSDMGIGRLADSAPKHHFYDADDAINDKGLFIGLTFAFCDQWSYGLVSTHIIKLIAETCATVRDALDVFKRVPVCCPKNFFIADKNGDMVVVEHTSKRFKTVYPKNDILIQTNHYIDPELAKEDTVLVHVPKHNTFVRYNEALERISSGKEKCNFENLIGVLGTPGTFVCQNHPNIATIWSLALDMRRRKYTLYWDIFRNRKSKCLKI
jgi:predicted choloylglycine hydrolase